MTALGLALADSANPAVARRWLLAAGLLLCLLVVFPAALSLGALTIPPLRVLQALMGAAIEARDTLVVLELRLPRAVMAMVVGAGLGLAGAAMQGLFRNPLADPALIGMTFGATLGAVFAIVLGESLRFVAESYRLWLMPFAAFFGALLATLITQGIARLRSGDGKTASLLLAGIAINALVLMLINALTFISDDRQLRDITFWTMGSLNRAGWSGIAIAGVALIIGGGLLLRHARELDALQLGEVAAGHLGIDLRRLRWAAIIAATILVGVTTAFCGVIGFIGLLVPHGVRLFIGPAHRFLLPFSAAVGSLLLLVADIAARMLAAPVELPVGLMTSAIGSPFFFWLLIRREGGAR